MSTNFRQKGASPTNHCWCQKIRVIVILCDIKISAVHCLVLSQSTRVTDGQTDRRTDRIMTANTALAAARAVKLFFARAPPPTQLREFSLRRSPDLLVGYGGDTVSPCPSTPWGSPFDTLAMNMRTKIFLKISPSQFLIVTHFTFGYCVAFLLFYFVAATWIVRF